MAAQLPYPYPDELFYSVVARYFAYFPPASLSGANRGVVGKRWCSIGFGSNLNRIAELTLPTWGMRSDEIVERHTLMPYHGAFLEPSAYLNHVQRLCMPDEKRVAIGGNGRRGNSSSLRHCVVCVSQDLAKFGETYWRRRHQLPGVFICTEHDHLLRRASSATERASDAYVDATAWIAENDQVECVSLSHDERRLATEIAEESVSVLAGECNKWTKYEIRNSYVQSAIDHGFNVGREKVDTKVLVRTFQNFFGTEFFRKINYQTGTTLFRFGGASSPLTNVLMQIFLRNHIEKQAFEDFLAATPLYGWKCPNDLANHLDSFRIENVVRRKSRLGYEYFHAKCACGFAFAFRKATDDDPLMPRVESVSHWSEHQQKEARVLFKRFLNVKAVATAMKVSHRTASKLISSEPSKLDLSKDRIDQLRKEWERDHSRATYQALLKHDRVWILNRKGGEKIVGRLPIPVEHDNNLASDIRAAIAKIGAKRGTVTLGRLSDELGFRLVRPYLDDYPHSKAAVLAVCPVPPWRKRRSRDAGAALKQPGFCSPASRNGPP